MIIGQKKLIGEISDLTLRQRFPRFSIFVGSRGSGADLFAKLVSGYFDCDYIPLSDVRIDTIRDMIEKAYKHKRTVVYGIGYADNMSLAAKNALLKVAEEPPNNAYIVMALEDEHNMLETIRSRATVYRLLPYTYEELSAYCGKCKNRDIILKVASNPGEIGILRTYDVDKFYKDMTYLADNVAHTDCATAFTLTNTIAIKDEKDKYDLVLSLKAIQQIYLDRCEGNENVEEVTKNCMSVIEIGKTLKEINIRGINKQMMLDDMILSVRKIWKN